MSSKLSPVTAGDILREEFLKPLGLSARTLARELGWPPNRVTALMNGERRVTAETAIALSRRFGTTAEFWMHLQAAHDLDSAGYVRRVRLVTESPAKKLGL
jgi:addiction module HigA family antidote